MEEIIDSGSGIDYTQPVIERVSGGYVVVKGGLPYHVTESDPWHGEVAAWAAGNPGSVAKEQPPEFTPEELREQRGAAFGDAISARLDAFAKAKGYDNMDKARLAALTDAYRADGEAANAAYAATWEAAIGLWEDVAGGHLPIGEALDELPELAWPGQGAN
jgi:hypothetical protein